MFGFLEKGTVRVKRCEESTTYSCPQIEIISIHDGTQIEHSGTPANTPKSKQIRANFTKSDQNALHLPTYRYKILFTARHRSGITKRIKRNEHTKHTIDSLFRP